MFKQYQLKDYKFSLIFLLVGITTLGILVIGSAKESVQDKQIIGLVMGLTMLIVISLIDYQWILNLYWLIYFGNVVLLLLVRFLGDNAGGAQRWFEVGGIRFQPSELSKILIILFFAKYFMKHEEDLNTPKTILKTLVLAAIPLFLILKQPDLSTTIVTAVTFCVLFYVTGLSYKFIGAILAIGIPIVVIFISIVIQPDQTILDDYQQKRILAWISPSEYADTAALQQENSKIAIGSGQLKGKGLNNDEETSVKNGNFIPEPQTDFIFAVAGEELGFVGCTVMIGLLFIITIYCLWIARRACDLAGRLIATGMATLIAFQSFINIGVATGLVPNTGLPLPFISYGLTSLVSLYIGMGFVLNVGLQPKKY